MKRHYWSGINTDERAKAISEITGTFTRETGDLEIEVPNIPE